MVYMTCGRRHVFFGCAYRYNNLILSKRILNTNKCDLKRINVNKKEF